MTSQVSLDGHDDVAGGADASQALHQQLLQLGVVALVRVLHPPQQLLLQSGERSARKRFSALITAKVGVVVRRIRRRHPRRTFIGAGIAAKCIEVRAKFPGI